MPFTTTGNARIYYETRGEDGAAPALFIQGFTAQLIGWREEFLERVAERGVRVIVFDNRDVGLSEKLGGPEDLDAGYGLEDMAEDGFAVLDALGLERAHLVGQSMGGMMAQAMVRARPERLQSLSLIYTTPTVERKYFVPKEDSQGLDRILTRLPRDQAIEAFIDRERESGSTAYPFDEAWIRSLGERGYDRCYSPDGCARQYAAMRRWRPNPDDLANVDVPVAIIHGRDDGQIKPEASFELARLLEQSELHIYPGMGHELVEPLWDEYAAILARTIARGS